MAYNLIITDRADELIDECVNYLINKLKNATAAKHLVDELDKIYDRLEDNPLQFPDTSDPYLRNRGYKEALLGEMEYRVVFRIDNKTVYIVGVYHDLENYISKVIE